MKKSILSFLSLALSSLLALPVVAQSETVVTLAGNAYVTEGKAHIDEHRSAIRNWNNTQDVISFYFKTEKAGKFDLTLKAKGHSQIEVSLLGKKKTVKLNSDELTNVKVGTFKVTKAQYVKVDIRGKKLLKGDKFGSVSALLVGGEVGPVVCVNEQFSTHFGRRGPSVHLGYPFPKGEKIEWFYNEVVVPEEGDIPSSYYMACGFGEGYFGMQNNSPHPRRILFSVWSPYSTDNPAEIPESMRVQLLKKGPRTKVGEFGNEGSGGQSYMHYDWKAGERCRFLIGVRPDDQNTTIYTAYFYDNHENEWVLVASWRRPQTSTWYTNAHSFLENFNPVMGYKTRRACYNNQWACTKDGEWIPVTEAVFTHCDTGRNGKRLDYTGGADENGFYLMMGGFFDGYTKGYTRFTRKNGVGEKPNIDFSTLE